MLLFYSSWKAESASSALTGGNDSLFQNRKERGGELFITRLTCLLGFAFFMICFIIGF
ncbi:MAG: preprotein translocase subunit SecG [Faecalibacillus intestinalis]